MDCGTITYEKSSRGETIVGRKRSFLAGLKSFGPHDTMPIGSGVGVILEAQSWVLASCWKMDLLKKRSA